MVPKARKPWTVKMCERENENDAADCARRGVRLEEGCVYRPEHHFFLAKLSGVRFSILGSRCLFLRKTETSKLKVIS